MIKSKKCPIYCIKRGPVKVHSRGFSVYVLMTTKLRALARGEKSKDKKFRCHFLALKDFILKTSTSKKKKKKRKNRLTTTICCHS